MVADGAYSGTEHTQLIWLLTVYINDVIAIDLKIDSVQLMLKMDIE